MERSQNKHKPKSTTKTVIQACNRNVKITIVSYRKNKTETSVALKQILRWLQDTLTVSCTIVQFFRHHRFPSAVFKPLEPIA